MKMLLNLYPPAWQRRYRREVSAHLDAEPTSLRTALDLTAGAVDAWLNPQWIPTADQPAEESSMNPSRACTLALSRDDEMRNAGTMIGVSLLLTTIAVVLDKTVGDHFAIDALLLSAFFIALTFSRRHTLLADRSPAARNALAVLTSVGWYAFFTFVFFVAGRV